MKNKKIYILIILFIIIYYIFSSIYIKNKEIHYNSYNIGNIVVKKHGKSYISLREFFEELDYIVNYDSSTDKIIIYNNRDYIEILDGEHIKFNDNLFEYKNIVISKNNMEYIALDSLDSVFGFSIKSNGTAIEIKGINMYKFDDSSKQLFIYNKDKTYTIRMGSLTADDLIQLSKDVRYPTYKTNSPIDNDIIASLQSSIKPKMIREVYRTNEGNDVVELYQYFGENIYPYVMDVYFSYDAEGCLEPFEIYDNMGLVLTFDRMTPSKDDLEYFKETYSEHNFKDNMLAFYDIPIVAGETKGRIHVYDDSENLKTNYEKDISRSLTYSAYYNEKVDIPSHIISLDKENIIVSKRTINSDDKTEFIEEYHYTDGMLDKFIKENNIQINN